MNNGKWFLPACVAQLFHSISPLCFANETGKPRLHIPDESLVMLREMAYSWRKTANMFMITERTILRMYQSILYINIYSISDHIFYLKIYFIYLIIVIKNNHKMVSIFFIYSTYV